MKGKRKGKNAYKQRDRIRIAKFDGTLNEEGKRKVMNNVRSQAREGMNDWEVPKVILRITAHEKRRSRLHRCKTSILSMATPL